MQNMKVSFSAHNTTISLDIPIYILEMLRTLGMKLAPYTSSSADINIYDSSNIRIRVIDNNISVTNDIISSEILIFRLFIEIEDLLMRRILRQSDSGLALHGGGVVLNDKAILVLQGKGAGKSTLIAKLSQTKVFKYLSDDLILWHGDHVLGIPLPIRLRCLNVPGLDLGKAKINNEIISGFDFDNVIRYFYMPSIAEETNKVPISTILIPHYDSHIKNNIIKVKGNEKISVILNQVKKYPSMEQVYKDILLISNNVNIYHLYYKDFSILDPLLYMLHI